MFEEDRVLADVAACCLSGELDCSIRLWVGEATHEQDAVRGMLMNEEEERVVGAEDDRVRFCGPG